MNSSAVISAYTGYLFIYWSKDLGVQLILEGHSLEHKQPPRQLKTPKHGRQCLRSWTQNSYDCPCPAMTKIPLKIAGSES